MKRFMFPGNAGGTRGLLLGTGLVLVLSSLLVPRARANSKTDARKQFEQAVKLRTMLEGYLEKDRSLDAYKETVVAYHKVYMITPEAEDATRALIAEAELYEEMGRLYDPQYFQSAIQKYNFLLRQYPGTRYRAEALFAIGQIQKDDLNEPQDAQASFKQFLKRFPRSDEAGDAQKALREIAGQSAANPASSSPGPLNPATAKPAAANADETGSSGTDAKQAVRKHPAVNDRAQAEDVSETQPNLNSQAVEPRVSDRSVPPSITNVQTWNSNDSTRIIVTLTDTIRYDSARIPSPERVYFDLFKARISPKVARKTLEVNNGLLTSMRVAQNKPDVVRLVLNLNGAKDYSAFLLAHPYRLVIDVHSRDITTAKAAPAPVAPAAATPEPAPAVTDAPARAATAALSTSQAEGKKSAASSPAAANVKTSVSAASETPIPPAEPSEKVIVTPSPHPAKSLAETAPSKPKDAAKTALALRPPPESKPMRDGDRSLTRALGLKISRIVIDPGHGGHDTGTIGPHGLMEKDLCLDVALRLGKLIGQKLPSAEVIYTRKDDSYVPLEERTAIANQANADLFISIHANSSPDPAARGVETYYLNFATTKEAMDVAARENALSQEPLHDLQDLIKKIARNDKIEESREFAGDLQDSLAQRLQLVSRNERNRGVKKAPFIVLIGANMPSVLTEISFLSNPHDERLLRKSDQQQRIAEGLYRGISAYLASLNSLSNNEKKLADESPDAGTVASNGNPK